MRTTEDKLAAVAEATGGGFHWLVDDALPAIRRVRPDRDATGGNWIGLRANGDYIVTGVRAAPLLPGFLVLALALGFLIGAWRRGGRERLIFLPPRPRPRPEEQRVGKKG